MDTPAQKRPLSLGVIFLTLYIDLVGFSIIFPLGPYLVDHYLKVDGQSGILRWLVTQSNSLAHMLGHDKALATVLLGGILTSVYSILQFVFAPFWGSLSDRLGRRRVLLTTVAGTGIGYLIWVFSGSFWLFLVSRLLAGAFSGNLSVATAAVADVTTRQERSRAMGIVGAAFGLGLVTGPGLGGLSIYYHMDLAQSHPGWVRFGINPFSVPALISLAMCLINLVWIYGRFKETLSVEARAEAREPRLRNPIAAILMLDNADVRRANIVAFVYSVAFVAMETCITYFAAEHFHYTAEQNTMLLVFLGVCSIITQGFIVRRLLKKVDEIRVLGSGLLLSISGLACLGLALHPSMLYIGLGLLATGSGLVNPSTTGLISLYSSESEQGRVLGIFRSLGSLSRAITPLLAGVIASFFHYPAVFIGAAAVAFGAFLLALRLPKPVK